jgi:hypothetical protein
VEDRNSGCASETKRPHTADTELRRLSAER